MILFKCKWFEANCNKKILLKENKITSITTNSEWHKDKPYILASQAKKIFYIDDLLNYRNWKVVKDLFKQAGWDLQHTTTTVAGEFAMFQTSNSSSFILTVKLGDLEFINLTHEDGEH